MTTSKMQERPDGSREWRNAAGEFHREDGPAIERPDGTCHWYLHGRLHREGGPAVKTARGQRRWYLHGQRHREDGPAVEWPDGSYSWHCNGQLHREGGPAVEAADGTRAWYRHGQLHREDGPAMVHASGAQEWWVNGEQFDADELEQRRQTWNQAAREARTIGTRQPGLRDLLSGAASRATKTAPALTPIDVAATSPAPIAVERELDVPIPEL